MGLCNECKDTGRKCKCKKEEPCGCPERVDLLCVTYNGDTLTELEVTEGDNGETILDKIQSALIKLTEVEADINFSFENIGTGEPLTIINEDSLAIKKLGNSEYIKVTSTSDGLFLELDEQKLRDFIEEKIINENLLCAVNCDSDLFSISGSSDRRVVIKTKFGTVVQEVNPDSNNFYVVQNLPEGEYNISSTNRTPSNTTESEYTVRLEGNHILNIDFE